MEPVSGNLARLRQEIEAHSIAAGRGKHAVHLVAVSKMQPENRVIEALEAGQRLFGENRVQDALARWTSLKPRWPDIRLHLIGPLQTNKAFDAVALFDCIETIDRPKLVDAVTVAMTKQGRKFPCMIQVNTGHESQKSGTAPEDLPALLHYCSRKTLVISGLMCIPPQDEPPALHFALLKKLADRYGLPELSMGMSMDYAKAIALGATHVRIGSALFGKRHDQ